jgi:uncharacterized protein with NRDE domain
MCLLALFYRVVEDAPLVVGANREEAYSRGGEPPRLLGGPVPAAGGVDPLGGGTWLGVNARGVVVAVTNRPKSARPAQPRSRGLLVRELLGSPDARAAAERGTRELDTGRYEGCNLLVADAEGAVVVHAGDWLRVRPLPPGLHVLANRDVHDATDGRVVFADAWLRRRVYQASGDCVAALRELLPLHEPQPRPMCFRLAERGSVSSSILVVKRPLAEGLYLHAQGPPDVMPYADVSHLLRALTAEPITCAATPSSPPPAP